MSQNTKQDNKIMKTFDIHTQKSSNPMRVPEGYFDNLTQRIMDQLPEVEETATTTVALNPQKRTRWIGWTVAAAACIALAVMVAPKLWNNDTTLTGPETALVNDNDMDQQYEEQILEYAMVDNTDIYAYLSGY